MLLETTHRSYASARDRIDAALGEGLGVSAAEAYAKLAPELRPAWILDELIAHGSSEGIHRYDQSMATGELDGPSLLAKIAETLRPHGGALADTLRWVAHRGAENRAHQRNESFVSIVNPVIAAQQDALHAMSVLLAERWPEGQTIEALPEPQAYISHTISAPALPKTIAFEASFSEAVLALFQAGVADGAIEEYAAKWEAKRQRSRPAHPLEIALGRAITNWGGIFAFPEAREETLAEKLGFAPCLKDETRSATDTMRAALRTDPEGLYVRARDLDAEAAEMIVNASYTGCVIVIFGRNPEIEALIGKSIPIQLPNPAGGLTS